MKFVLLVYFLCQFLTIKSVNIDDADSEYKYFRKWNVCPVPDKKYYFNFLQAQLRNAGVLSTIAAKNRELKHMQAKLEICQNNNNQLLRENLECQISISELKSKHNKGICELESKQKKKTTNVTEDHTDNLQVEFEKLQMQLQSTTNSLLKFNKCWGKPLKSNSSNDLYSVSWYGSTDKVLQLLEACADPNGLSDNSMGFSSLMGATIQGHKDIAILLLKYGANIEYTTKDNDTALIWACLREQEGIVELLLENGANVNHRGNHGSTAIYWAARKAHVNIMRTLLEAKANVNIKDNTGLTPLAVVGNGAADTSKNEEIVALLKAAGATK